MRVLWTISYFSPYVSGLTECVARLTGLLEAYQHTVLCNQHNKKLAAFERLGNAAVYRAKYLLRISKGFLSVEYVFLSIKLVRQADVVVINLPQLEGIVTALIAKIMHRPVVVIYHCEIEYHHKFIQTILETSHRLTMNIARKIVFYTSDYLEHSRLASINKDKCVAIYPPVPVPGEDKKLDNDLRKTVAGSNVVLGFAGRLAREKGIEYLVGARSILELEWKNKSIKLVCAGPLNPVGEESYRQKIFSLVKQRQNDIVFLGNLDYKQMRSFYRILDVLVLPSVNKTEAFGLVQVEAMLSGTPTVATDLPGVRVPVLKTGNGAIAKIADTQSLAEAIKIVVNKKLNRDLIIKRTKQVFSLEKTKKQYEQVFAEVFGK